MKRRTFLASAAAVPFAVGSFQDTFVIHRALGDAIDLNGAGEEWFWHDFVPSEKAKRIANTIFKSAPAIKEHADLHCELLAWKCWHGDESLDTHLRRLAAFVLRTGFEVKSSGHHQILIAHSDEKLRIIEAAKPDRSEEIRASLAAFRREHRRSCRERRLVREKKKLIQNLEKG